jgi:hypothetical protein
MQNVRIIPAIPKENNKFKAVTHYRVSTIHTAQLRSLELQIKPIRRGYEVTQLDFFGCAL